MGVKAIMGRDDFTITRQPGIKYSATTAASMGEERKSKFTQYTANLLCRAPLEVNRKQSRLFGGLRYHTCMECYPEVSCMGRQLVVDDLCAGMARSPYAGFVNNVV